LYKIEMVQSHIAAYLFQLNRISLPGLGSFSVIASPAVPDFSGKIIKAPVTAINFSSNAAEANADDFLQYIAKRAGVSYQQATEQYHHWYSGVQQQLAQGNKVQLAGIGTLSQQNDEIVFGQSPLPPEFFPTVPAERVVHPEAQHTMLVGDKETTNVQMTEYFAATPDKKDRWWIGALLLALLGSGIILFQLMNGGNGVFGTGNACKCTPADSGSFYRVIE
jgi:nucleoid DNA-binding protein